MNRNLRPVPPPLLLAAGLLVMLVFCWRMQAAFAAPPVPAGCVPHTTFVHGGSDYPDDFRCAGSAIEYHTGGVARSPYPIWAGQWLLVDEAGNFRFGMCTFNRGIHPTIDRASTPVAQSLPNDPGGAKSAYLTWRYGQTRDDTVATALWAVFHFYARDAAGSNRASNASAPLVPSLQGISGASGRQDLEDLAISLDAEASRLAGPFSIDVLLASDGSGSARVHAGSVPVPMTAVSVRVQGAAFDDDSQTTTLLTDGNGVASFEIVGPAQAATVVATTSSPGPAEVYRAAAADPVGHLPQTLITAGNPQPIQGQASVIIDAPPTTTTEAPATTETPTTVVVEAPTPTTQTPTSVEEATTTTVEVGTTMQTPVTDAPTTTDATTDTATTTTTTMELPTTTTEQPTTTTEHDVIVPFDTAGPATVETEIATTVAETTVAETTIAVTTTSMMDTVPSAVTTEQPLPAPEAHLPRTGSSNSPAYIATSLLVAGIGLIGVVRRRLRSVG